MNLSRSISKLEHRLEKGLNLLRRQVYIGQHMRAWHPPHQARQLIQRQLGQHISLQPGARVNGREMEALLRLLGRVERQSWIRVVYRPAGKRIGERARLTSRGRFVEQDGETESGTSKSASGLTVARPEPGWGARGGDSGDRATSSQALGREATLREGGRNRKEPGEGHGGGPWQPKPPKSETTGEDLNLKT
ncbi:hypothetical protein Nepgr_015811 [Nepenthes gracilis]|uniref:Uncharacterized protein n=1 Tax=Nepenthes gracilis TaxID=150966 RepID=A0AAD3SLK9_NEPGR|nr:hypothetical protein Nepgr_015811 [Nepenthes gracilis]